MNYWIAENTKTYVFKLESGLRLYIKLMKLNIGFMVLNNLMRMCVINSEIYILSFNFNWTFGCVGVCPEFIMVIKTIVS